MIPREHVIAGAIPCALLSDQMSSFGFQPLPLHVRSRLTTPISTTSTDPRYISHLYDVLTNASAGHSDTRVILNRGLTVGDDSQGGLGIRGGKKESGAALLGSIDSSQMVKNLCASHKYHPMDYFITLTCNQLKHFGTSIIKEFIDSSDWHQYYTNFAKLNHSEQEEITSLLSQAASGLILRNWQEVCKLFIQYLRRSRNSPFRRVGSIFARNEYQATNGNLSHIHLMLQVRWDLLSNEERIFVKNLIRGSVGNIVKSDEVQHFINSGIFQSVNDYIEMQEDAKKMLPMFVILDVWLDLVLVLMLSSAGRSTI